MRLEQRRLVIALTVFAAFSAIVGGLELVVWHDGNQYVPIELLAHTPFSSFLVPGLILGLGVGGTSLFAAAAALRRSAAAIDVTIVAGGTLFVWIVAEAAMFRAVHMLHVVYGGLGLAILWLGLASAWRSGARRHRWVITVTLAETLGFLFPTSSAVVAQRLGLDGLELALVMVAAGTLEGLALGTGQAMVLPVPVRRRRYAVLTALAAGVVWAAAMFMVTLGDLGLPVFVLPVIGVPLGLLALCTIGAAQWLELRRHSPRARAWIASTALAWTLALPLAFTPAPFVDEQSPIAAHISLWACAGLLMAFVMALVTWQGVRRALLSSESCLRQGARRSSSHRSTSSRSRWCSGPAAS